MQPGQIETGYPGAKTSSAKRLISLMPKHSTYVEAFAGSASLYRAKRPADRSVLIEINPIVAAWLQGEASPQTAVLDQDAVAWIESRPEVLFSANTLLYLDPPYLGSTRSNKRFYDFEMMSEEDHARLLNALRPLPCLVMLSGYPSELYDELLADWYREDYMANTRQGLRMECCWCNFPPGMPLHDPRFVGSNYKERWNLKKRRLRWVQKLRAMSPEERQNIMDALLDVYQDLTE